MYLFAEINVEFYCRHSGYSSVSDESEKL